MSRFETHHPLMGRRALLQAIVAGAGLAAVPGLAACGSSDGGAATDTV